MAIPHGPADEYNTLRSEVLQGRKYVFERPLLIVTMGLAALNFIDKNYVIYLPPMAVGLLMFNLWFTVNRLRSTTRIVAYIQVELEEKLWQPWLGWETALRHYRIWMKQHLENQQSLVSARLDLDNVPASSGYYPTIYIMHFVLIVAILIANLLACIFTPATATHLLFALTSMTTVTFAVYALGKWRPRFLQTMIEEDIIRWHLVFEHLSSRGIKTKIAPSPADAATSSQNEPVCRSESEEPITVE